MMAGRTPGQKLLQSTWKLLHQKNSYNGSETRQSVFMPSTLNIWKQQLTPWHAYAVASYNLIVNAPLQELTNYWHIKYVILLHYGITLKLHVQVWIKIIDVKHFFLFNKGCVFI